MLASARPAPTGRATRRPAASRGGLLSRHRGVAAPRPFTGPSRHARAHRVKHDIAAQFVQVGLLVHEDRLVAPLEQMSDSPVAPVGALGVDTVELAHALGEIAVGGLHHQVVVVGHVVKEALAAIDRGGYAEAIARIASLLMSDARVVPLARIELKRDLMEDYAHLLPDLTPDARRRIRGEQDIIVRPDQPPTSAILILSLIHI